MNGRMTVSILAMIIMTWMAGAAWAAPELTWGTYLGGDGSDVANAVAVDPQGNLVVVGQTSSPGWVSGGYDVIINPSPYATDVFVIKLTPAGQRLWSTYAGGMYNEEGRGVALDAAGNIYAVGVTTSPDWAVGGYDETLEGGYDAFVIKLSPTGQHMWSTYVGGPGQDMGYGIAVDQDGNPCLTGQTNSAWAKGGYQPIPAGDYDAFVAKLSPEGEHLWSTYLGGDKTEAGWGIATDGANNILLTGVTYSDGWTSGGYLTRKFHPKYDYTITPFAAKLAPDGRPLWSTYLGSADLTADGQGRAITADAAGNVYIVGDTYNGSWTSMGSPLSLNGQLDCFVVKLSPGGGHLWSTRLGGNRYDYGFGVAVGASGAVYAAGYTDEASWIAGGLGPSASLSFSDGFVAKLSPDGDYLWSGCVGGAIQDYLYGLAVSPAEDLYVVGSTNSSNWMPGGVDPSNSYYQDGFVACITHTDQVASGSLSVTLAPPAAVAAGARWRRAGTAAWLESGATDVNARVGANEIEFLPGTYWLAPANRLVSLTAGQTAMTTVTFSQGGGLRVTLNPSEASAAGARWRVAGTRTWLESGVENTAVPAGTSTIEFKNLTEWATPPRQPMTVRAGQTTETTATYCIPGAELSWVAYLGGLRRDEGWGVATDSQGDLYVTGCAYSTDWHPNGYDSTHHGGTDAFAARLSATGELRWSTYLGGSSGDEAGCKLAVDGSGNIVVATQNLTSNSDSVVYKLSPEGRPIWSYNIGGRGTGYLKDITLDSSGSIYVTGSTYVEGWLSGGYSPTYSGIADAFVLKLSPAGQPLWGTYLGGGKADFGEAIAVDHSDNVYVAGCTASTGWTSGGFNTTLHGGSDGFVAKLNPWGQLLWSTYLGGEAGEGVNGIAVDPANNVCVVGDTASAGWTSGGYDTTYNGSYWDGFACKLSPAGQPIWSTYLGGTDEDHAYAVAVNENAEWFVVGETRSPGMCQGGFDLSKDDPASYYDGYILKLAPTSQPVWGSYLGGSGYERCFDVACGAAGRIYVTGYSDSWDWVPGVQGLITHSDLKSYTDAFIAAIHDLRGDMRRGSVSVILGPPEAVAAGAQWRRGGSSVWLDSGATATNAPVGGCTIDFKPLDGWIAPRTRTVAVGDGQTTAVTATYVRQQGSLRIDLSPPQAVAAGAQWRRAGTVAWLDSATTETGITTGYYSLEFKDTAGWAKPGHMVVQVAADRVTTAACAYSSPSGALRVRLAPPEAADAGARWRRVGQATWRQSNSMAAGLTSTSVTVEYQAVAGWDAPATQSLSLAFGQVTETTGTYTRQVGALAVTINPPAAVAAGAMWRRVGTTAWLDNGTTETGVPAIPCQVEFKPVTGWNAPVTQTVTIVKDQTSAVSASYAQQTGSLQVSLYPPGAVTAGAKWRRVGTTAWLDSDFVESGVPAGNQQIECLDIAGWSKPSPITVTITANQTRWSYVYYTKLYGALRVQIAPAAAASGGAQWRRVGTATWRASGATETGLASSACTVEFSPLSGWITPPNQIVSIVQYQTAQTTGTYVQPAGGLHVTLAPPEAVAAGAQWRRVGTTAWRDSGSTESGVPIGPITVEFKPVAGWKSPQNVTLTIIGDQTNLLGRSYIDNKSSVSGGNWQFY